MGHFLWLWADINWNINCHKVIYFADDLVGFIITLIKICILVMEKGEQLSLTWRSGQFPYKR